MAPQRKFIDNVRDMFDLRDVYHDVVNFSESNRERAMRKLERIKNVFTAMRWGEQRPLTSGSSIRFIGPYVLVRLGIFAHQVRR